MNLVIRRSWMAACLAGVLSGCGTTGDDYFSRRDIDLPEEPGIYATAGDGELQRLDGPHSWETETWPVRSELSPESEFVVYDPALLSSGTDLTLWRVAWARSELAGAAAIMPLEGTRWVVARIDPFEVPIYVRTLTSYPDFRVVVPMDDLEPGLYQLELTGPGGDRRGRLGVGWSGVDKRLYASAHCVDRYSRLTPPYRTCDSQGATMQELARQGLSIALVDPVVQDGTLLIQGVVVNRSDTSKPLPALEAQLLGPSGDVLKRWSFQATAGDIEPGGHVSFQTSTGNPPADTAQVNVRFAGAAPVSGRVNR